MGDRYHRAARDGNLDMLREATRRDSNRPDEDGMTPTLLAAYSGNLWALRLLIGRGGNPDCCDLLGNTALHLAAANGHTNCAEYLVSFGCNIWAVDNDLHAAFYHASLHDHKEITNFLDNEMSLQLRQNRKTAEKLKTKAVIDAEKNRKKYEKLQEETLRRMEKDEKRFIMHTSESQGNSTKGIGGTINKVTKAFASIRGKIDTVSSEPKVYSGYFNDSSRSKKVERNVIETLDYKSLQADTNGYSSVRSGGIISHDKQVIYTNPSTRKNGHTGLKSLSPSNSDHNDHNNTVDSGIASDDGSDSGLFSRPNFGNISFLPKPFCASHLNSLPSDNISYEFNNDGKSLTDGARVDVRSIPWTEEGVENLDNKADEAEYSALEMFLSVHNLTEFLSHFTCEKVDFEALLLLNEEDMIQMGLPLGPRRKLHDAIARRREAMETSGVLKDTHL